MHPFLLRLAPTLAQKSKYLKIFFSPPNNFRQGSPMKMNFDESQQQERSPFADSKYMLSEEIELIIKTQMAQLNVQNPYLEDYYFFAYNAKKS